MYNDLHSFVWPSSSALLAARIEVNFPSLFLRHACTSHGLPVCLLRAGLANKQAACTFSSLCVIVNDNFDCGRQSIYFLVPAIEHQCRSESCDRQVIAIPIFNA